MDFQYQQHPDRVARQGGEEEWLEVRMGHEMLVWLSYIKEIERVEKDLQVSLKYSGSSVLVGKWGKGEQAKERLEYQANEAFTFSLLEQSNQEEYQMYSAYIELVINEEYASLRKQYPGLCQMTKKKFFQQVGEMAGLQFSASVGLPKSFVILFCAREHEDEITREIRRIVGYLRVRLERQITPAMAEKANNRGFNFSRQEYYSLRSEIKVDIMQHDMLAYRCLHDQRRIEEREKVFIQFAQHEASLLRLIINARKKDNIQNVEKYFLKLFCHQKVALVAEHLKQVHAASQALLIHSDDMFRCASELDQMFGTDTCLYLSGHMHAHAIHAGYFLVGDCSQVVNPLPVEVPRKVLLQPAEEQLTFDQPTPQDAFDNYLLEHYTLPHHILFHSDHARTTLTVRLLTDLPPDTLAADLAAIRALLHSFFHHAFLLPVPRHTIPHLILRRLASHYACALLVATHQPTPHALLTLHHPHYPLVLHSRGTHNYVQVTRIHYPLIPKLLIDLKAALQPQKNAYRLTQLHHDQHQAIPLDQPLLQKMEKVYQIAVEQEQEGEEEGEDYDDHDNGNDHDHDDYPNPKWFAVEAPLDCDQPDSYQNTLNSLTLTQEYGEYLSDQSTFQPGKTYVLGVEQERKNQVQRGKFNLISLTQYSLKYIVICK